MVKVRPTSDAEVARSAVTRGKAGVYMSVANGGTALCKASVSTKEVDTAALAATPAADRQRSNRQARSGSRKDHDLTGRSNRSR